MKEKNAAFVFSGYEFGDEEAAGTGKIVHVPERLSYREALSRTVIFTSTVLFDREKLPDSLLVMPACRARIRRCGGRFCAPGIRRSGWTKIW